MPKRKYGPDEIVAPEARDDEHVGFAHPRREIVDTAHFEMADARVARGEPLGEPIRGMGEADGESVFGRQRRCHPRYSFLSVQVAWPSRAAAVRYRFIEALPPIVAASTVRAGGNADACRDVVAAAQRLSLYQHHMISRFLPIC